MNSLTSDVPLEQQAVTVERLDKRIHELNNKIHDLQESIEYRIVNRFGSAGILVVDQKILKNTKYECRDTQSQLLEALGPPVDSDDRLEKRLNELEGKLYELEGNLGFLNLNPMTTVGNLQSIEATINTKLDEIRDIQAQLIEARRPRDVPQNDRFDNSMCCICHESKSRHELFALVPCGHRCVCAGCASLMMHKPCPVCRTATIMAMRVFD
jgi:uncharacterized coiled-coil protein SlyX